MDVNTDLVRGNDVMLFLTSGDTVLAYSTSCSLQIDGETIDTSNKMSCRWNSALAGSNGYTVSADALYTRASGLYSFDALLAAMVAGDAIDWKMATASGDCETGVYTVDDVIAEGEGFITSLSLEAGNNEVASCSITITGSGELTAGN